MDPESVFRIMLLFNNKLYFFPILSPQVEMRNDSVGAGSWQAPRGSKLYNGVDILCTEDDKIYAPIDGDFSKYGWVFDVLGKEHLRYIQISGVAGDKEYIDRMMYCTALDTLKINTRVNRGQYIGIAQTVSDAYQNNDMLDHIHFEVKSASDDSFIDPTTLVFGS